MTIYRILCTMLLLLVSGTVASAQHHPERRIVREGNEQFERMNYRSSLNLYNEALEHDSTRFEILYNRANAYYQTLLQHRQDSSLTWEASNELFEAIANDELLDKNYRAEALRNIGESLFTQQKYEAALNAFRESLLLNPDDGQSKYNYVLTKRIVDQLRQQQQNQQQNSGGGDSNGNEQGDNPPREQNVTTDEQERMLDLIQAQEDKTQGKLNEKKKAIVIPGKKNW